MVCQVGKVLINAIPRVYDSTRQVRILEEDGTSSMVTLHQTVFDEQSQQNVELNDLSKGDYDVLCDFGPAFNSQQKETTQAFLDMAAIDPSFLQQGKDIMLKNLAVPGMDQMAERARVELLNAGLIPETQWTDEERQQIQAQQEAAQNQPPQEDPLMIAARAEELKGQADMQSAQNKQAEVQGNQQLKMMELQLRDKELNLRQQEFDRAGNAKFNVEAAKIDQGQQKIDQASQQMQIDATFKAQAAQQQQINDAIANLKTIQDASGDATIIGPGLIDNMRTQSDIVSEKQNDS